MPGEFLDKERVAGAAPVHLVDRPAIAGLLAVMVGHHVAHGVAGQAAEVDGDEGGIGRERVEGVGDGIGCITRALREEKNTGCAAGAAPYVA